MIVVGEKQRTIASTLMDTNRYGHTQTQTRIQTHTPT